MPELWRPTLAKRAIDFFGYLHHFKGEWAGRPLTLQPWQAFVVGSLFGWVRPDSTRRFRTSFVEVPRGQGKSTMAAGLLLYGGFFDGEEGAENYCIATKRDQARIVFDTARNMVLASPALRKRVGVQRHNLHVLRTASKLQPLGADADTLDGLRPHVVTADEVHAHPTSALLDVIQTGMGTRQQPLMFEITTAGVGRTNVWWAHREYSSKVLSGILEDDAWFAFIACADPEDDWTDPAIWRKANPNFEVSVKREHLEAECRKAIAMAHEQNRFRRLHLGQLVEQEHRAIDMRDWTACAADLDWDALTSLPCYGGLDLSTTTDLTAFALVWALPVGGYAAHSWLWCPADQMTRRVREDRVPYDVWGREGQLTPTPGNVVDYSRVRADIVALARRFRVQAIGYDPWNATQLAQQLQDEDGLAVVQVRQGFASLSEPTKLLLAQIAGHTLRVSRAHQALTWMASNVVLAEDPAGNVRPDKAKAIERIDGVVAIVTALSQAIRAPAPPEYQVFVLGAAHG